MHQMLLHVQSAKSGRNHLLSVNNVAGHMPRQVITLWTYFSDP